MTTSKSTLKSSIREELQLGELFFEKCELAKSEESFSEALRLAKRRKDLNATLEALTGLLRLADEACNEDSMQKWEREIEKLIRTSSGRVPPMVWYCQGFIARSRGEYKKAQRSFHKYLRVVRDGSAAEEQVVRAWLMLALTFFQRGNLRRAQRIGEQILRLFEEKNHKRVNGHTYFLLAKISERRLDFSAAKRHYHKAHSSYLAEHNWLYHLHILHAYARIARMQRNYTEAYWYLDLLDKAISNTQFATFRNEVLLERANLEQDAVDLLIDSHKGIVKRANGEAVSLGKQYVLLHILHALSEAHNRRRNDSGLSKAEIIESVWGEPYRPEAHDNKLYYNINRLRKLIEPDTKQPQILLNWKEGYRLAPGLKVHFVGQIKESVQTRAS